MSDSKLDWIANAGMRAKGRRPDFLGNPTEERMLSILLAVAGEVSVLKERLDTVERLLESKRTISRADIEAYTPDSNAAYERALMTREYLARIMRGVQQDMESMQVDELPVADISTDLRDN
ncbi:MAG: hypothetical protein ABIT36_12315 [Steroidobacteraceae bacterium]